MQYTVALLQRPTYAEAHANLAGVLVADPRTRQKGLAHYATAIRLKPGYADAHYNLGTCLADDPSRRQDAVAGAFDHAPVVNGNAGVDQVASQRPEPRQNAVFVGAREP